MPKITREPTEFRRHPRDTERPRVDRANRTDGITKERLAHLNAIKEQIRNGYYNSDFVIEDLSHSFTKAVDMLI